MLVSWRRIRTAAVRLVLALSAVAVACADPPDKEIHQAQGAIDTARAAGAEMYAPEQYKAAVDALRRAHDAVDQRDYRLALNHALDAFEQAQEAAKQAASRKAAARSEAEREADRVASALKVAEARLKTMRAGRATAEDLTHAEEFLDHARASLQKAREAIGREDYLAAKNVLKEAPDDLKRTGDELDRALSSRAARRRR